MHSPLDSIPHIFGRMHAPVHRRTCIQHICTHTRSHDPSIPQQTFCCFLYLIFSVFSSVCIKIINLKNHKDRMVTASRIFHVILHSCIVHRAEFCSKNIRIIRKRNKFNFVPTKCEHKSWRTLSSFQNGAQDKQRKLRIMVTVQSLQTHEEHRTKFCLLLSGFRLQCEAATAMLKSTSAIY